VATGANGKGRKNRTDADPVEAPDRDDDAPDRDDESQDRDDDAPDRDDESQDRDAA
jgi:hypothetical protein